MADPVLVGGEAVTAWLGVDPIVALGGRMCACAFGGVLILAGAVFDNWAVSLRLDGGPEVLLADCLREVTGESDGNTPSF